MILSTHADVVSELVVSYRALPLYKRSFFPRLVVEAINRLPPSQNDYTPEYIRQLCLAYLNTTSPYKTAFRCLKHFSASTLMDLARSTQGNRDQFIRELQPGGFEEFYNVAARGDCNQLEQLCNNVPFDYVLELAPKIFYRAVSATNILVARFFYEYLQQRCATDVLLQIIMGGMDPSLQSQGEETNQVCGLMVLQKILPMDMLMRMIATDGYRVYRRAAKQGDHEDILILESMVSVDVLKRMIAAVDYDPFRLAAANGDVALLQHFETRVPARLDRMLKASNYGAYRAAAANHQFDVLRYLEDRISPYLFNTMLAANDYEVFWSAAAKGDLELLAYLEGKLPNKLELMIAANNYAAYRMAASNGHCDTLAYLESKTRVYQHMIVADNYAAYQMAAANRHFDVLWHLERKVLGDLRLEDGFPLLEPMITAKNNAVFCKAAAQGYIDILERVVNLLSTRALETILVADNYAAFRIAAANGQLNVLEYLETKALRVVSNMIHADGYAAFRAAAANGHLHVLIHIETKEPVVLQMMIEGDNYAAFRMAAAKGHLCILKYLEAKAPKLLNKMIAANNYAAFRMAAASGHVDVLEFLEVKVPGALIAMIAAKNYAAFRMAAASGRLDVLQYLEYKVPGALKSMIAADNYAAFRMAAANGHLSVLRYLETQASDELLLMIKADKYGAFCMAAANGRLWVLDYLKEKLPPEPIDLAVEPAPNLLVEMIYSRQCMPFKMAAAKGYINVLEFLEAIDPRSFLWMIKEDNYAAVRSAIKEANFSTLHYLIDRMETRYVGRAHVSDRLRDKLVNIFTGRLLRSGLHEAKNSHSSVMKYLFTFPEVFAYAEERAAEYGEWVNNYIFELLNVLREHHQCAVRTQPWGAPFDVDPTIAKQLFYVVRHLIRRDKSGDHGNLLFLLQIPSVKLLVYKDVARQGESKLLRVALSLDNRTSKQCELAYTVLIQRTSPSEVPVHMGGRYHKGAGSRLKLPALLESSSEDVDLSLEQLRSRLIGYNLNPQEITSFSSDMLQVAFAGRLRALAIQHLCSSQDNYARGFRKNYTAMSELHHSVQELTWSSYVMKQAQDRAWGTYIEAGAIGEALGCRIAVTVIKDGWKDECMRIYPSDQRQWEMMSDAVTLHIYCSNNIHYHVKRAYLSTLPDGNCLYNALSQALQDVLQCNTTIDLKTFYEGLREQQFFHDSEYADYLFQCQDLIDKFPRSSVPWLNELIQPYLQNKRVLLAGAAELDLTKLRDMFEVLRLLLAVNEKIIQTREVIQQAVRADLSKMLVDTIAPFDKLKKIDRKINELNGSQVKYSERRPDVPKLPHQAGMHVLSGSSEMVARSDATLDRARKCYEDRVRAQRVNTQIKQSLLKLESPWWTHKALIKLIHLPTLPDKVIEFLNRSGPALIDENVMKGLNRLILRGPIDPQKELSVPELRRLGAISAHSASFFVQRCTFPPAQEPYPVSTHSPPPLVVCKG